ncbi:polysaccharide biosynthesis domain containing protein 1 [Dinochytrium kinnereticum]|nr:polysaccharide biosynthesis domain containing protein 1 [Dinochytrium kinnereticum]
MVGGITAENAENHPDIEKQWAVKAMHHAETYFKLISSIDPARLRLTKIDDEIYKDFRTEFPDLRVEDLKELEDFKTEKAKERWRNWITKYEKTVVDYNFGTLLRINPAFDYSADNSFFATAEVSDAILNILNESSVGLYRVQEHVFKKVPQLVSEQRDLEAICTQVELASSDLSEAQELVAKMGRITGFSSSVESLNRLHSLLPPSPSK